MKSITYIIIFSVILLISLFLIIINRNIIGDKPSISLNNNSSEIGFENDNISKQSNSEMIDNSDISTSEKRLHVKSTDKSRIVSSKSKYKWRILLPYGKSAVNASVTLIKVDDKIRSEFFNCDDYSKYIFIKWETTTNSYGLFYIDNLPLDLYLLHAELDGYGQGHCEFDIRESFPLDYELKLSWEKTITGKVIDINGDPIKDIFVEINRPYLPYSRLLNISPAEAIDIIYFSKYQYTDDNGYFCIEGLPKQELYLTIEGESIKGYSRVLRPISRSDHSFQVITLRKSTTLEGYVYNQKKEPIPKVTLWDITIENAEQSYGDYVITDDNGYYIFENTSEGKIFIDAKHIDYGNFGCFTFLKPDINNKLDIVLPNGISKKIIINDKEGKPLSGIRVTVYDLDTGSYCINLNTNDQGYCIVTSLVLGHNIKIVVDPCEIGKGFISCTKMLVVEDNNDINISLDSFNTINYYVYDKETNSPIEDFVAYTIPGNSLGHEDFCAKDLKSYHCKKNVRWYVSKDCTYTAWFISEGYIPHKETINILFSNEFNNQTITRDVFLEKGKNLTGTILDSSTNQPVMGASISLQLFSNKTNLPIAFNSEYLTTLSDNNGNFKIGGIPDSTFILRISCNGYSDKYVFSDLLNISQNCIFINRSASIFGRLLYENEEPVSSAYVHAYHEGIFLYRVNVSNIGYFVFSNLPSGKIQLHIYDHTHICIHGAGEDWYFIKNYDLLPCENKEINIILSGNSILRGICKLNNTGISGVVIKLIDSNNKKPTIQAETITPGDYILSPVSAGAYTIRAEFQRDGIGGVISKNVHISDNEQKIVNFDFNKICFEGCVSNSIGSPIYGSWLTLLGIENQSIFKAYTGSDGKYAFYDLPQDSYKVSVCAPEYAVFNDEIVVSSSNHVTKNYILKQEGVFRLVVKVIDGKGVSESIVKVLSPDNYIGQIISNSKGLFVFKNLEDEKVSVITGGGSFAPTLISASIVSGETVEKTLSLRKGGFLEINAFNIIGAPLKGAKIYIQESGLYGLSWAQLKDNCFIEYKPNNFTTSDTGTFKIGPLPVGEYSISINYGGMYWNGIGKITSGSTSTIKTVLQ